MKTSAMPHDALIAQLTKALAADAELARIFLARARPLATARGEKWPQAFEDATRRHLKNALSLEI